MLDNMRLVAPMLSFWASAMAPTVSESKSSQPPKPVPLSGEVCGQLLELAGTPVRNLLEGCAANALSVCQLLCNEYALSAGGTATWESDPLPTSALLKLLSLCSCSRPPMVARLLWPA